ELGAAVRALQPADEVPFDARELQLLVRGGGDGDPGLRALVDAVRRGRVGAVGVRAVHEPTRPVGDDDAARSGLLAAERRRRAAVAAVPAAVRTTVPAVVPAVGAVGRRGRGGRGIGGRLRLCTAAGGGTDQDEPAEQAEDHPEQGGTRHGARSCVTVAPVCREAPPQSLGGTPRAVGGPPPPDHRNTTTIVVVWQGSEKHSRCRRSPCVATSTPPTGPSSTRTGPPGRRSSPAPRRRPTRRSPGRTAPPPRWPGWTSRPTRTRTGQAPSACWTRPVRWRSSAAATAAAPAPELRRGEHLARQQLRDDRAVAGVARLPLARVAQRRLDEAHAVLPGHP